MKPKYKTIKYSDAAEIHFIGGGITGRYNRPDTPTEKARKAFPALVKASRNRVTRAQKLAIKAVMLISSIDEKKYSFEKQLQIIRLKNALCKVCDDITLIKKSRGIM